MIREKIQLKFWQAAGLLTDIADVADSFYTLLQGWLEKVTGTIDAETAPIELVELLGWERDIDRFTDEPDALFRLRVKHALANAKDAGSKAGFERIWVRLELGAVIQTERYDEVDWDVIMLEVSETVFGQYSFLFDVLVRQYGRTCRRYVFSSIVTAQMGVRPFMVNCDISNVKASL